MSGAQLRARLTGLVVAALVLTACPGNGDDIDYTARDSEIYRVVIDELLDRSGLPAVADDPKPVVFIEALDPGGITLEVQVQVIADLEDRAEIRFIDERKEAVDDAAIELPVRDGGVLLGLGPVPVDGPAVGPVDVRGERYRTAEDVMAYRFQLARQSGVWQLTGSPERVDPEGLVGSS